MNPFHSSGCSSCCRCNGMLFFGIHLCGIVSGYINLMVVYKINKFLTDLVQILLSLLNKRMHFALLLILEDVYW